MVYNTLVRDRISEIIQSTGKSCTIETLSTEDYIRMIDAKLDEELADLVEGFTVKDFRMGTLSTV